MSDQGQAGAKGRAKPEGSLEEIPEGKPRGHVRVVAVAGMVVQVEVDVVVVREGMNRATYVVPPSLQS